MRNKWGDLLRTNYVVYFQQYYFPFLSILNESVDSDAKETYLQS